jgi:hypothetical protein
MGILRGAAQTLGTLHAAGMVHGAVCAENIVLDDAGAVRLCRDTVSPPTLSPEQRRGDPADARSDVYALGAAVADLLRPADAQPEPLLRLLATMMAEDPGDRYQSMGEVLMALEACELMTGHEAVRPGRGSALAPSGRRLLLFIVLAVSLAMLGLAFLGLLGRTPPARGTPPGFETELKHLVDKAKPPPPK